MKKYAFLFLAGGSIYSLIEILWRKYTHYSMFFAGGLCLVLLHRFCNCRYKKLPCIFRYTGGAFIITAVEFVTGVIVNLCLHLDVWDYSRVPGNIMGQICPVYTILWFFLSIPAAAFGKKVDRVFEKYAA